MREAKGRRFLVINSSASFAATWLVGRIGKFKARHPEIDVLLDANPTDDSLESGATDALIRWGAGEFPGLATTLLFKENVFPVCAPDLAKATVRCARPRTSAAIRCCISNGAPPIRRGRPGPTGSRQPARAMSRRGMASGSTTWRWRFARRRKGRGWR